MRGLLSLLCIGYAIAANVYFDLQAPFVMVEYALEGCQIASNCNLRLKQPLPPILGNTSTTFYGAQLIYDDYDLAVAKNLQRRGAISCSWKAKDNSKISIYADFALNQHNVSSRKPFQSCLSKDYFCHPYNFSADGDLVLKFVWSNNKA